MSGPVRRQSAPAATPREYPTASACHPWAWLPPFRFVASAPPIGSPSLDLPQTLPRLRGRTPPPQPHVQPVHASHANRASASWSPESLSPGDTPIRKTLRIPFVRLPIQSDRIMLYLRHGLAVMAVLVTVVPLCGRAD